MRNCVIASAVRTAVGGYLGSLKTMEAPELCSIVIKSAIERGGIDKSEVQEIIMGEVHGYTPNVARCGALLAGISEEVPSFTVDRQCASSLQAVISATYEIAAGEADVIIAGGVESMSRMLYYLPTRYSLKQFSTKTADPMPPPMHNVAMPYRFPRLRSSYINVVRIRVPLFPRACPCAMAPPFTFSLL